MPLYSVKYNTVFLENSMPKLTTFVKNVHCRDANTCIDDAAADNGYSYTTTFP